MKLFPCSITKRSQTDEHRAWITPLGPQDYSQRNSIFPIHSAPLGESFPVAHAVRNFCVKYPNFDPRFTLPGRSRQPSRPQWTANLPYKARCMSLLCPTNGIIPTSVGVNTFSTIMLLALTTNCDGGVLLTTQSTHLCLILPLILRGG